MPLFDIPVGIDNLLERKRFVYERPELSAF